MRILKVLLSIIVILIAIFIVGGFFIPDQWELIRSRVIHAKAEKIYPFVSNFKEWKKWSPWSSTNDPTLHYTYEGPEMGVGAKQSWTSEKMGKGWMQITSANPETGIDYELHIDMGHTQPTLNGSIMFAPANDGSTTVTWRDQGDSGKSFLNRWMSVFIKPMLGKNLETGLANLQTVVEKR